MKEEEVSYLNIGIINFVLGVIPLIIALTYPKAAEVLGIIGSASGFLSIYTIPCVLELKRYKTSIENPLLLEALEKGEATIDLNAVDTSAGHNISSPMISIREELVEQSLHDPRKTSIVDNERTPEELKSMWIKFYLMCFGHSLIIIWGAMILILQFVKIN